jgi:hypothetical protein
MANDSIEVSIPNTGPVGPQGPPGEFGDLEAPEDGIIYGRKDAEWVDMTAPANLQVRRGTAAEVAAITPLEGEPVWATDTKVLTVGDGSALGGIPVGLYDTSTYVVCRPGDDFATKYAAAKALTPNGSAKAAANRATLIVFPGNYSLGASAVTIDEEFVDIIGLAALRTYRGCLPSVFLTGSTVGAGINVTANDARIFGIQTERRIDISSDKPLQVFECCRTIGNESWNAAIVSGTFINCQGQSETFAGAGQNRNASGTFVNCTGSFGGGFGSGQGGIASGTFINCAGTFGSATCSGTFWHCEGSFAPSGNLSGKLYYCRKTSGTTFKALTAPGAIRFCIDGSGNAQADLNP